MEFYAWIPEYGDDRPEPACGIAMSLDSAKQRGRPSALPAARKPCESASGAYRQRREVRAALENLPPKSAAARSLAEQYDALSEEFGRRVAWAVDMLLADPEALGNDALETDLYLLREKLREQVRG